MSNSPSSSSSNNGIDDIVTNLDIISLNDTSDDQGVLFFDSSSDALNSEYGSAASEPGAGTPSSTNSSDGGRQSPIDAYFSQFIIQGFEWKFATDTNLIKAFKRLMKLRGIKGGSKEYDKEKAKFQSALDAEFTSRFGQGDFSLDAWRRLCSFVGIDDAMNLGSITKCRKELNRVFINIVDLIQVMRQDSDGKKVRRFENLAQLRKYTKKNQKYMKKENAKHSVLRGLLKVLL